MTPSQRTIVVKEIVEIFEKNDLIHGSDKACILVAVYTLMVQTDDEYRLDAIPRTK